MSHPECHASAAPARVLSLRGARAHREPPPDPPPARAARVPVAMQRTEALATVHALSARRRVVGDHSAPSITPIAPLAPCA